MKKIAINGFGRIGRAALRISLENPDVEVVAINDPSTIEQTAHLFQFDTNFGTFKGDVSIEDGGKTLNVDGHKVKVFSTREISELPWGDLGVDTVLECTGVFRTKEGASKHLAQGAKKVVISAPGKDDSFATVVLGVNEDILTGDETLLSNASCTTNCLAPFAKVLHENFEIKSGLMTTIHAYTTSQNILDMGCPDLRRARAAAANM
ncbi:MAG: type I glyceraldehyde-3-phosphate dehydrogenase, partial [Candidatus Peregrinibacteria bacterium]|nr:type I glyceraldehyde-3-phosphate dehydrogenase [Candidatus Peregrinibacteria bacterium]